ncbi:MAG: 2-hydroxyacyl-CoA dehydratase [Escherichia coli]|nr:2-hydroxyacyl-CoA dehydratase [Escherichia coli]
MSLVTDLPAIFDQFSEARQTGFLTVMDLKERGIPLVGTYCTFMPQEIPMAAGAVVVSLCSTSDETIEEAEKDLPRNLCPLIKSSYGFGKTDTTFRFDKEALINELDAMTARVRQQWEEGQRLDPRPRILITGCPIGGAAEKVVRAIEENGGWVVGYENCTGAKATEQCVAETGDVYDALADKYLAIGCSCVSPNDQRLKMLSQMVEEYQVDGVVDVILQACHTYAVESLAIKRHVRQQHNIPYIAIETDYSTSDVGQLSTRVAAFIEML